MPSEKTRRQLQAEIDKLTGQLSELREKQQSDGSGSGTQSIIGVKTLTLRYDVDSREILHVNTPFANYVRMKKDELIGQPLKVLASVLGADIYKEISSHDPKLTIPPRISDASHTVYEVLTTEHDGVIDVVMRDMTEAQQFKNYVQRYFGLDFESLSDEDKRSLSFPERRFITISFTDLRGFTKFTESNNPEEVRNAINAYFDEVIEAAEENDVFPNQIVGDEVMVLYGAPKYHRDHPLRAIKTTCEHIERVTRLRSEYARHGREIPHCGIGINSGDVIVGDMGSSVRDRKTYTALGTAVNLAARLCSAATPGQIILSEATLNAVLRVLPDGWEHTEKQSGSSSNIFDPSSDKPQGKIEDVIPLPKSLQGKEILIGPGVASKNEEAEFTFQYLFQIKAKGIADALPVLTVERTKHTAMSKSELSDETEANEDGEMILGRYRLVAHIGRGGMGTVWRARDEFVNTVAIKMLNAGHGASESQVARFKREAKVMGKLAHRNICRIHEIGKAEGRIFIAMQFIDGISLEQLISHQSIATTVGSVSASRSRTSVINEGSDFSSIIDSVKSTEAAKSRSSDGNPEDGKVPGEAQELIDQRAADIGMMVMTHQQSLTIVAKICDAVQFAHERGVLHRDLKPANIMIGRDGEPIVMDFGLAKLTRDRDGEDDDEKSMSISIEGQVVGTIEYMAPEQALSSKDVNEQADVYSIGAIFYHLLTGNKPFRSTGHILADAKALQDHEPIPPRRFDKYIDPDLETIILKALQPDRTQRYKSVMQVRQDLERYQAGDPISARKPTLGYRVIKKYRKNRVAFISIASVLAVLIIALIVGILDWKKNYGKWKTVLDENFSNLEVAEQRFIAFDRAGSSVEKLWEPAENGKGIRLLQDQWLWFIQQPIRTDAKVEVDMRYKGDPEGFQICLNGNHEASLADWEYNPVGYACRYGIWRGTTAAITANQESQESDINKLIRAEAPAERKFTLTFEREQGLLTLSINKDPIHQESVLLPLRGNDLHDIGFRTWSDGLIIEAIRIYRFTLPIEASPTVAGDALVEINENESAIEKYLTIADDYLTQEPGRDALSKAFQLWFQTYLNSETELANGKSSHDLDQLFRDYRDKFTAFMTARGLDAAQAKEVLEDIADQVSLLQANNDIDRKEILWAKIETALDNKERGMDRSETEQMVAPLRAIELFSNNEYRKALDLFPGIVKLDEYSRIAIECLNNVENSTIPRDIANELLPWIARTRNVAGVDLHSMKLQTIDPLGWIQDLTALYIPDNEITSLDSISYKPLKVLDCKNNQITSLDPLDGMLLDELYCDNNQITDVGVLAGMTSMHTFSCQNNQITDLAPLVGVVALQQIFCSNNQIKSLDALSGKPELYDVYCSGNPVTDLSPLANAPELRTLDIRDTNITSVAPLKDHPNLSTIYCTGGRITDLDVLNPRVQVYEN